MNTIYLVRLIAENFSCPPNFTCGANSSVPVSNSLTPWVDKIFTWIVAIALILMVILTIIGGFLHATSTGNAEGQQKASAIISGSIVGTAVIIVAFLLIKIAIYFLANSRLLG